MKAGVSIVPCASVRRARRAAPSVLRTENIVIPDVPEGTTIRNPFSSPMRRKRLLVVRQGLQTLRPRGERGGHELRQLRLGLAERDAVHVADVRKEHEVRRGRRLAGEGVALQLARKVLELLAQDLARRRDALRVGLGAVLEEVLLC